MRKAQKQFLSAGDMSADVASNPVGLDQDFGFAIQANYSTTGTLGGVLKLQASVDRFVDQQGNVLSAGNWVDIDQTSVTLTGAGHFIWNVPEVMYPFVRLFYAHHSGDSGSLDAFYMTRGF